MRFKFFLLAAGVAILGTAAFLFVSDASVFAQAPSPEKLAALEYPIAELGNCANQEACAAFCEKPKNGEACLAYAETHDLMPKEDIEMAKRFIAAGSKGPGGCTSKA